MPMPLTALTTTTTRRRRRRRNASSCDPPSALQYWRELPGPSERSSLPQLIDGGDALLSDLSQYFCAVVLDEADWLLRTENAAREAWE